MADLRAARRYAAALFGVALRQNALEQVERDLETAIDLWESNPRIGAAMVRPQLPLAVKQRIWDQLLQGAAGPLLTRFVGMLVEKRRIDLLPDVAAEFRNLLDRHRNVVRATVTTAVPLTADMAELLRTRLGGASGRTVVLAQETDPAILGGAIVRIGDRLMDGSLRSQLQTLRRRLAGARY